MAPSHAPSKKSLRDARRNSAASRLGSDKSACRRVSAALQPHWPAISAPATRMIPTLFDITARPPSYLLPKLLQIGLPHLLSLRAAAAVAYPSCPRRREPAPAA